MTSKPNVLLIHGAFADARAGAPSWADLQAKGYHVHPPPNSR